MTKKERARRLKQLLAEHLLPEPGNQVFIEVFAPSANCLAIEMLHKRGHGREAYMELKIREPNIVQKIYDFLTQEGDEAQEPNQN